MSWIANIGNRIIPMEIKSITEKTLIPIGLVITLAGFIFWISSIFIDGRYTKEKVNSIESRMERIEVKQQAIDTTQARFSEKLDNITKSLDELKQLIQGKVLGPDKR